MQSAINKYIYDDWGNLVEDWYFDINGNLIDVDKPGYAFSKRKYYYKGNIHELSFYNNHEKLITRIIFYDNGIPSEMWAGIEDWEPDNPESTGVDLVRMEFNKDSQLVRCSYYNSDENIVERKDTGTAVECTEYDTYGNIKSITGFKKNGEFVFKR